MTKLVAFAFCAMCAITSVQASYPSLSIGKETVNANSKGWVSDTYTFSPEAGSAIVVRSGSHWSLYLDNVFMSESTGGTTSSCLTFHGTGTETLHVFLNGQNILVNGGINTTRCGKLSIHGPGSLSETVTKHYAQAISSPGDLWIGEGASISVIQLAETGSKGAYTAIGAEGNIAIVNSAVSVVHSGSVLGVGTIGCEGSMGIEGSVIAVCSDIPSDDAAIHAYDEVSVSHSSVTIFGTSIGLAADGVSIDTSAIGISSWTDGIVTSDLLLKNTAGLVMADDDAIRTEYAEFRSGNNLSLVGNADKENEWNAAIHLNAKDGLLRHSGGRTTIFAPNGTGILADGGNWSSHAGNADVEMLGGTLAVSSDPDWIDARTFFTAASIASAAETVLQGAVSGTATLSLLQNFFAAGMVDSWLGYDTLQISSAKPVRGVSARSLLFKGGQTEVTCQTDANGILYTGTATVSGGTVRLNGKAWAPSVAVSFDANGGTVSTGKRNVSIGATVGTLPTPKRAGWVFTGWFTAKSGGAAVTAATKVSKATTFYAHWAKPSYWISFQPNGGKGTMKAQKMAYGKAAKLRKNAFRRKGCVFLGWAKTPKGTLVYKNAQAVKNLTAKGGTVRLYAKWGRKVAISFNANGGTVKVRSKTAVSGRKAGNLPTPTRKKWTFDGWWTKKTGGKRVTASTTVTKAMTVYAHWTPVVTLKLHPNGGTMSKRALKCKTYLFGGAYYLDTSWSCQQAYKPTRSTFSFDNWHTKKTGGTALWNVKVSRPCTMNLYAHWSEDYQSVHFMFGCWTDGPKVITKWEDDWNNLLVRIGQKMANLPVPTGEGYKFTGWWTQEEGGKQITENTIADGSFYQLYARWRRTTRNVSFYSNGEWVDSMEFAIGEPLGFLPSPGNGGPWDIFMGWKTAEGVTVNQDTIFDDAFDTLYASWKIGSILSPTGGQ